MTTTSAALCPTVSEHSSISSRLGCRMKSQASCRQRSFAAGWLAIWKCLAAHHCSRTSPKQGSRYDAPDSACDKYRVVLRADGTASRFSARCRGFFLFQAVTGCEVKHGGLYVQDFARLAHTIEQSSGTIFSEAGVLPEHHPLCIRNHTRDVEGQDAPGQRLRIRWTTRAVDDPPGYFGSGKRGSLAGDENPAGMFVIRRAPSHLPAQ